MNNSKPLAVFADDHGARVLFRAAGLFLLAFSIGGCAGFQQFNQSAPVQTQVVSETKKDLTPVEKEQRFQLAFAQGLRYIREEQYGIALAAFEQAVKLRPDSDEALFNLAACHEAVGDPLRAIHIYKVLVGRHPNDPDCYTNLGTSYIKMYHREKTPSWREMAVEAWTRSLSLRGDQPNVQKFLAQARSTE